jgi:hypothetical protein
MLRGFFLIAQPPLLGEEGKIRHTTVSATAQRAGDLEIKTSEARQGRKIDLHNLTPLTGLAHKGV